jgi:nucleotide-binding universal stress UspA family protein
MLLGPVTENVLREAPCPVLTVPPRDATDPSQAVAFKRVLCPTDFSPSALLAFEFALNLARQADGAVTLLHCIEWLAEDEPRTAAQFDVRAFRQRLQEDAKTRLDELVAAESRTWATIDTEVVVGRPYREVLKAADARQSDLIVMGAQGRGGLGLALFGSTTQQVVRGASCPVLTVRETAKAS